VSRAGRQLAREVFTGRRLRASTAALVRVRSAFMLVAVCVLIGVLAAVVVAAFIGATVQIVLHAFGSGP
jgi:hypothetical protein